jgi:hypothetical protein
MLKNYFASGDKGEFVLPIAIATASPRCFPNKKCQWNKGGYCLE